jgi:hypothetical protein
MREKAAADKAGERIWNLQGDALSIHSIKKEDIKHDSRK